MEYWLTSPRWLPARSWARNITTGCSKNNPAVTTQIIPRILESMAHLFCDWKVTCRLAALQRSPATTRVPFSSPANPLSASCRAERQAPQNKTQLRLSAGPSARCAQIPRRLPAAKRLAKSIQNGRRHDRQRPLGHPAQLLKPRRALGWFYADCVKVM